MAAKCSALSSTFIWGWTEIAASKGDEWSMAATSTCSKVTSAPRSQRLVRKRAASTKPSVMSTPWTVAPVPWATRLAGPSPTHGFRSRR